MERANALQLTYVVPLKDGTARSYGQKVSYILDGRLNILKKENSETQTGAVEFWTKQCCRCHDNYYAIIGGAVCSCGEANAARLFDTECDTLFSLNDQLFGQNLKTQEVYSISMNGKHKGT